MEWIATGKNERWQEWNEAKYAPCNGGTRSEDERNEIKQSGHNRERSRAGQKACVNPEDEHHPFNAEANRSD